MHKPKRLRYARDSFIDEYVMRHGKNQGIEIDRHIIEVEYLRKNFRMRNTSYYNSKNRFDFFSDCVDRINRAYSRLKRDDPDFFDRRYRTLEGFRKNILPGMDFDGDIAFEIPIKKEESNDPEE